MKIKKQVTAGIVFTLLISAVVNGQFFEEEQQDENAPFQDNSGYFDNSTPDPGTPETGEDAGPGNPGDPVPADDWLFLLPVAGIAIGAYFLRRKKPQAL